MNYAAWNLAGPQTWFVWGALLAVVLALLGRHGVAYRCAVGAGLYAIFIALTPVGYFLLQPLETRYASVPALSRVDGLVVLAGAERLNASERFGMAEVSSAGERLMASANLAHRFPRARVMLVGGMRATDGKLRDIDVMRDFLLGVGVARERLILVDHTRNTFENLQGVVRSGRIDPGETWVLITSASHMPRAMGSARCLGVPLIPFPVDHQIMPGSASDTWSWHVMGNLERFDDGLREWVSLGLYWSRGRLCSGRS